jgi:hypothetical protein
MGGYTIAAPADQANSRQRRALKNSTDLLNVISSRGGIGIQVGVSLTSLLLRMPGWVDGLPTSPYPTVHSCRRLRGQGMIRAGDVSVVRLVWRACCGRRSGRHRRDLPPHLLGSARSRAWLTPLCRTDPRSGHGQRSPSGHHSRTNQACLRAPPCQGKGCLVVELGQVDVAQTGPGTDC